MVRKVAQVGTQVLQECNQSAAVDLPFKGLWIKDLGFRAYRDEGKSSTALLLDRSLETLALRSNTAIRQYNCETFEASQISKRNINM